LIDHKCGRRGSTIRAGNYSEATSRAFITHINTIADANSGLPPKTSVGCFGRPVNQLSNLPLRMHPKSILPP